MASLGRGAMGVDLFLFLSCLFLTHRFKPFLSLHFIILMSGFRRRLDVFQQYKDLQSFGGVELSFFSSRKQQNSTAPFGHSRPPLAFLALTHMSILYNTVHCGRRLPRQMQSHRLTPPTRSFMISPILLPTQQFNKLVTFLAFRLAHL